MRTPRKRKLSIVIPVYNEEKTISTILEKVARVKLIGNLEKELIIVNDASTDGTEREIREYSNSRAKLKLHYYSHERNRGKGAALQTGIRHATGEFLVIQDADLEYDPSEYNRLLRPVLDGFADVVFGSRFVGSDPHRVLLFWHYLGNTWLTFLSNIFTNLNLTDMESGLKLFRTEIVQSLNLKEPRFGIEPELTAKISRVPGIRIYEVGISYYGRTYREGKKITWRDGLTAMYHIVRYNLFR